MIALSIMGEFCQMLIFFKLDSCALSVLFFSSKPTYAHHRKHSDKLHHELRKTSDSEHSFQDL